MSLRAQRWRRAVTARGVFAVVAAAVGLVALEFFYPGGISVAALGRFKLLIFFAVMPTASLLVLRRMMDGERPKPVVDAEEFLNEQKTRPICVLLRPFGADGRILINDQGGILRQLFLVWRASRHIETLICGATERTLGIPTVALADPKISDRPPGPIYLSASDDWRRDVARLLDYAVVVFVILPPFMQIRENVLWEVTELVERRMWGRVCIVLPPPGSDGSDEVRRSLRDLRGFFDFSHFRDDAIALHVESPQNTAVYYLLPDRFKLFRAKIGAATYNSAFEAILERVEMITRVH